MTIFFNVRTYYRSTHCRKKKRTIFSSCQFVGGNWEGLLLSLQLKSGETILKLGQVWWNKDWCKCLWRTSLRLLMLRRCRPCTGEEAECISRLMDDSDAHENFINFVAFADVSAISWGHHQSLHPRGCWDGGGIGETECICRGWFNSLRQGHSISIV